MKMSSQLTFLALLLQGVVAPDPFNQFMRQHYNTRGPQTPGTSGLSYTQYAAPSNTIISAVGTLQQATRPHTNSVSNSQPMYPGNIVTHGFETPTTGFQAGPISGPKLLSLHASAPTNNRITGVGTPGQTTLFQQNYKPSSQALSPLGSDLKKALTPSGPQVLMSKQPASDNAPPQRSNQPPSGLPQLPLGSASPQTVNQPQFMRSFLKLTNQPHTHGSGQLVQSLSGSSPLLQARLPSQNPNIAAKPSPGLVPLTKQVSTGTQSLPTRTQPLTTGKQLLLSGAALIGTPSHPTNALMSNVMRKMAMPMNQMPHTNLPQSPQSGLDSQTGSSFFLPPLQPASIHLPIGAAKPLSQSPVISQQMNTVGQALPGFSSPPLTYNPSRLEQWAIRSYTDDSVAKSRTLMRKSKLQLIAKRRGALANRQLSQALFIQPAGNNARSGLDRVMPDFLTLNAARDLDCETIPEVMGLNVPKYQPMGCDDDKCPPGKECRTLHGVGMCCPPSVTSQAIRLKSNVGRYEYLGLF